jgi:methanogenic corrinoid protein MtbC1
MVNDSKLNMVFQEQFLQALMSGNELEARRTINLALDQKIDIRSIYIGIISKSQNAIGDLWISGELGIVEEHLATQISLSQMQRLREIYVPRSLLGVSVVVAAVQNEEHFMGPRMVADFLYFDGWDTHFLGPNMPAQALRDYVINQKINLVALSATMPESSKYILDCVRELRNIEPRIPILVGGRLFKVGHGSDENLDVDAIGFDAIDDVKRSRELMGLISDGPTLEQLLSRLAVVVQSERKKRSWSQLELC